MKKDELVREGGCISVDSKMQPSVRLMSTDRKEVMPITIAVILYMVLSNVLAWALCQILEGSVG